MSRAESIKVVLSATVVRNQSSAKQHLVSTTFTYNTHTDMVRHQFNVNLPEILFTSLRNENSLVEEIHFKNSSYNFAHSVDAVKLLHND